MSELPLASTDEESRSLVSDASKAIAFGGLRDLVWGHVSIRDHLDRGIWMKRSGIGFEEVEPEDVQLIGWDGEVLAGTGDRHIEFHIHTGVYRNRPEVNAVVHAHSDQINAWASLGVRLEALTHAGVLYTETNDLPRFTRTANLIRNSKLADDLAVTLGGAHAVVIPHHGIVTAGTELADAIMYAVLLERAASTQLAANAAGVIVSRIDDELPEFAWPIGQLRAGYGYLVRQARRAYPRQ